MKADRKTTPKTGRGKSKIKKAKPTHNPAAPKLPEKKSLRKTSQSAQPQIENILERVSDGFVAFDADMNYTYVNTRGGEMLGRKPADLIGKNYWTEYPEAKGTPFAKAYVRALETQTPIKIEDYYQPFDRWFENRIYPSKDGLSIFFHDITDRKKAELALQEQERLTSAITNTIPALIYVYDMETQSNVYSNAGMEQLLGFSTKDIQAMGAEVFVRLIHPDDLQNVIDFQSKIMAAKDVEIIEIEYRMKDRDEGWHTLRSYERPFMRNADGSLKQKLGVAIDITERKQAEDALQRILRLYATLSQINQTIVRVKDREELFKSICRIAIEFGQFHMAWIGLVDAQTGDVKPVIHEGYEEGYLRGININASEDSPFGRGPSGLAIRTGKVVTNENIQADPKMQPWRDEALKRDYLSSAAVPFRFKGQIIGLLNLYASETAFFNEEQKLQLKEIGANISFALDSIAAESERKQAERALRTAEENYRTIFEQAPVGIFQSTPQGRFRQVNSAMAQIYGYDSPKEMIIGITSIVDQIYVNSSTRQEFQNILVKHGEVRDYFNENYRKDGSRIWTQTTAHAIKDDDGNILYYEGFITDVTERKRAEKALHESEERFRRALENIPDVIVIYDRDLRIQYINAATLKVTGRPISDFIGRREEEIWPPEVYEAYLPTLREAFETRTIRSVETDLLIPQEGLRALSITCVPVINKEGEVHEVLGITHNFTERKRAEEEIRHHLNQLMALNKTASQLQKLQSPQILATEIIKSLEAVLKYTYGAVLLIDKSGERLMPFALSAQNQGASFEEQDKRYIKSKDIRVGKGITGWVAQSGQGIRLGDVRQDARYLGIRDDIRSELCVPLKAGKQVIGVINIESTQTDAYSKSDEHVLETIAAQISIAIQNARLFEQVQEQTAKLEQRVLERTAQLTAANKELESFSYSVSHDLRAPLRAISGFSEIIARRHRTSLNEEGQHYFDNIIQASERMGHLIDDLLTYSRLGRAGLQMEPVSLADVLTNIAHDLKGHLDELHGTISIVEDLPNVTGDKTLLGQIFTNLLENAVKYRKADVPLQIIIDWQNDDEDVILRISDNGIGIPAEYQDKIFDIFQRLHSEEEYPGTGVGLATVKKSVELLGGRVWVESKVGEGSTFYVKLLGG